MCEIDHTPKQIPRIKLHSVNYHLAKLWDMLTAPKYEALKNYFIFPNIFFINVHHSLELKKLCKTKNYLKTIIIK